MNVRQYKEYLHSFPCVVCDVTEGKRTLGVQTHHVESNRDDDSDWGMVPLCVFHHSELHQLSRRGFERRYRLDSVDMLKHTIRLLMTSG